MCEGYVPEGRGAWLLRGLGGSILPSTRLPKGLSSDFTWQQGLLWGLQEIGKPPQMTVPKLMLRGSV